MMPTTEEEIEALKARLAELEEKTSGEEAASSVQQVQRATPIQAGEHPLRKV